MLRDLEHDAIQALLAGELNGESVEVDYQDATGRTGRCRLRHFQRDDATILICSEIAANQGPSITNAAPAPWQAAEDEVELRGTVVWIEHYGPETDGRTNHTFDRVTVSGKDIPAWQHLRRVPTERAA